MKIKADIGIIGGSGFYSFFDKSKNIEVATSYGKPSDKIMMGEIAGKKVAFLPRHGRAHRYPPHLVPYKANISAMKKLGVKYLLGPGAIGSLKKTIAPGHFVLHDQFIDRTKGREDTFVKIGKVDHPSAADIYDKNLTDRFLSACRKLKIKVHTNKTIVVINGPRFSSKAESLWYKKMGWDTLSMTQYPENMLAFEARIPYASIGLVTDYDAGLKGEKGIKPVTYEQVLKVMEKNVENLKRVIVEVIGSLGQD